MIEQLKERKWKISTTLSETESYCFIFSATNKEMGFYKSSVGFDESVKEKAFERALQKERQLKALKGELVKKQPLLFLDEE